MRAKKEAERPVVTPQSKFEDLPEMLTMDEFCRWLHVGQSTAYGMMNSGQIPCVRFGKSNMIRIPKSTLLSRSE